MKGVVLAAGKGARLRPLTDNKPKVLVEVNDRPILDDVFDQLVDLGISELVVVVGYGKQQIIDRYEDEYRGVPLTYAYQREQLQARTRTPAGPAARRRRLRVAAR